MQRIWPTLHNTSSAATGFHRKTKSRRAAKASRLCALTTLAAFPLCFPPQHLCARWQRLSSSGARLIDFRHWNAFILWCYGERGMLSRSAGLKKSWFTLPQNLKSHEVMALNVVCTAKNTIFLTILVLLFMSIFIYLNLN